MVHTLAVILVKIAYFCTVKRGCSVCSLNWLGNFLLYLTYVFKFAVLYLKQDLDAYATMYAGMAKLLRLMHIASRCRPLRVDALRLALNHVQSTHNVSMYRSIHTQLVEAINK